MLFRTHLYSEQKIRRYIKYCKAQKYLYPHIDALWSGGVINKMNEQTHPFLHVMIFKDGTDSNDTVALNMLFKRTIEFRALFFPFK